MFPGAVMSGVSRVKDSTIPGDYLADETLAGHLERGEGKAEAKIRGADRR